METVTTEYGSSPYTLLKIGRQVYRKHLYPALALSAEQNICAQKLCKEPLVLWKSERDAGLDMTQCNYFGSLIKYSSIF